MKLALTFYSLLVNSADDRLVIFFLFFPEIWIWYFMQIVFIGDSLHGMSDLVFWEEQERYFQNLMLSAENFTQSAKC